MGCGSCNSRRKEMNADYDITGGYRYLSTRQLAARLEVFKKRFCQNCNERFNCTYEIFLSCKNKVNQ